MHSSRATIYLQNYKNHVQNNAFRVKIMNINSSLPQNFSLNQSNKFWWQLKCSMRAHFDSVRQLTFSPDRPLLFTASDDCTLRMWDVEALNLYKK